MLLLHFSHLHELSEWSLCTIISSYFPSLFPSTRRAYQLDVYRPLHLPWVCSHLPPPRRKPPPLVQSDPTMCNIHHSLIRESADYASTGLSAARIDSGHFDHTATPLPVLRHVSLTPRHVHLLVSHHFLIASFISLVCCTTHAHWIYAPNLTASRTSVPPSMCVFCLVFTTAPRSFTPVHSVYPCTTTSLLSCGSGFPPLKTSAGVIRRVSHAHSLSCSNVSCDTSYILPSWISPSYGHCHHAWQLTFLRPGLA